MKQLASLLSSLPRFTLTGPPNPTLTALTADSRRVRPGSLFVAYRGVQVDGHRFLPDALARGAVAVVVEGETPIAVPETVTLLRVPDGREALAHLAAAWYDHPSRRMTLAGITGTDGKTTTTNLCYHILRRAGRKVGMVSTVNAVIGDEVLETGLHTTTPNALDVQRYLAQMADAGTEICLLEVTSHGLAHHRVTGCDFDYALVTNITHEHLDLHGSREAYRRAKARLFQMARRAAILNADDESFPFLQSHIDPALPRLTYGIEQPAGLRATGITSQPDATRFRVALGGRSRAVQTPLAGAFNVSNVLAALALTVEMLGVDAEVALDALRDFPGVPGRMERVDAGQPFTAIVDFAHTPNALRRALETVRALTGGRVIAIFGCAGRRDVEKRAMMGRVAAELADITILTAEDPRTEDLEAIIAATARAMR
ncbi:MAG: UDP-N-acetylmuramoyl-L-alanyl-D-glutamate--2,6-diaminopimelate ligase, partial [Caldilineae bacterium]